MSFVKRAQTSASSLKEFSSGIPSFEKILLGIDHIPFGSIISLHQDWPRSSSNYSNTFIKCLISSAIYSSRQVVIVTSGELEKSFLESCPSQVHEQVEKPKNTEERLKIAHRYKHLHLEEEGSLSGHKIQENFDLSSPIPKELLNSANIILLKPEEAKSLDRIQMNSLFLVMDYSSPGWPLDQGHHLVLRLKAACKKAKSILFVSAPAYCVDRKEINLLNSISDCVISFSSLSSSPSNSQAELKEYDGFVRLLKPFRVPFRTVLPSALSIAFKCKSTRRFIFEPFHLPPDLSDIASRQISSVSSSLCSSAKIDF